MSRGPFRTPLGGRIDRSKPIAFTLDGRKLSGFAGDTLASALLANGITLVGRSFKYHRPRGFLSAGIEEPNGLFTLGEAGRSEPNIAGTVVDLLDGLVARRQNGWPSVDFDLRAINGLVAPLLLAGFYYKTFMGPTRRSWMFYEPFIRRAAGLGRAVHVPDPDRYLTRHAFTDVAVVGGGPAGLAAALAAAQAGARVVIAEQDSCLGGSLLLEGTSGSAEAWRNHVEMELVSLPNLTRFTHTTAFGIYDSNTVGLVERCDHLRPDPEKGEVRQIVSLLRAKAIVFATGATERPLVFTNNDLPGVMLASATRAYLNRYGVACGRRAVLVTNNDSAYEAGFDLARAGVSLVIVDTRRQISATLMITAKELAVEILLAAKSLEARGRKSVSEVRIGFGNEMRAFACDLVGMSGGWSPNVHLTSHGGSKPIYRPEIAAFIPGELAPGQFVVGGASGEFNFDCAVRNGTRIGWAAARYSGHHACNRPGRISVPPTSFAPVSAAYGIEPIWQMPTAHAGKAFVDFQNDVTVRDLEIAQQEGFVAVEHLKRYTTLGMGTEQGKTSNMNALAVMAGLRKVDIAVSGTTTFRPPFSPVTLGALAGRNTGHHFRPTRRSPLHDWHVANGCEMIEAGPWMRANWYRWAGDTIEQAYVEEMRLVRRCVGISDVSTLGKIDVQGPDAGELLDRVYVNRFSELPIGKARYGVMLTDDGAVLDDGTTSRLAQSHFFMTTTTAQAGEVMSWLEFLLQTAWTDLKVHVTSVTDEWAAMVVSGPMARRALELALPGLDVSDVGIPYMAYREAEVDSMRIRIVRLSFSGELSYELYVPADYGISFWEHILKSAAPLGIRPYGLEALASLRIEKGHVAGLDLDHRNTLDDLGLGKMASREKAFVGRELRQRPLLQIPDRWSLVGLECLEPQKRLRAGAILFAEHDRISGHGRGYITSVTYSTELEKYIGLALYQGGLKHKGEQIVCAYPLKGERVRARIVSSLFIDPKGERMRA